MFLSIFTLFHRTAEQRCLRLRGQDGEKADWNCAFRMLALSTASGKVLPKDFKGGIITLSFLRLKIKDQNFLFTERRSEGQGSGLYYMIEFT